MSAKKSKKKIEEPVWVRLWDKASHPTRDGILFITGVLGIAWETLGEDIDRPYLLAVFCAMVGLPVFLHTDEKSKFRMDEDYLAFEEEES